MFVHIIELDDKNSYDILNELRSTDDQKSSCGQTTFSKHRTATLLSFAPFYYFLIVILLSYTCPHYLPVNDCLVLHADHIRMIF